ncbi:MAG: 30S ribosomal protein S20 [Phycisphaerae bacterium]|nr:30S ribosomal protein S20 [Phycisphaerae bacterium]
MAHSLSSKKRIRQNQVRHIRNNARKQRIRTEVRKFTDAVHDGNVDLARGTLSQVSRLLDQTAAKRTIHKNTASRRKSRLARRLNKLAAES